MKNKIQLGDRVKDSITGIIGIAVARTEWLHGCSRVTLQPQGADKERKPFESYTVDEPQLEIVARKKIKRGNGDTGGPRIELYQKQNVAFKR